MCSAIDGAVAHVPTARVAERNTARMCGGARRELRLQCIDDERLRRIGERELVGRVALARAVPVEMFFIEIVDDADLDTRRRARLEARKLDGPPVRQRRRI